MQHVLSDMKSQEASWSWATAVRAVLLSAEVSDQHEKASVLRMIEKSWTVDPICTSVVIVFWQRYLCRLAEIANAAGNANKAEVSPVVWIVDWMPLQGDRALPGELLGTMERCGWNMVSCVGQGE